MIKADISVHATFDVQRLKLCCMHWYFLGIVTDGIESRALRWLFFAARYTRLFMQTFRSAESKAENLLSWFEIWVGKTRPDQNQCGGGLPAGDLNLELD